MKTKITILLMATFLSLGAFAQNYYGYNARAIGYDISDNLDLEAVAYLFGESRNLQEFEQRLNDPRTQVSNLDLNNDGYVDYLRVIELHEYGVHLVTVQAVLDRNVFQDVATIDVGRERNNSLYVQVVGDPYLYGPNYIIEPVYVHSPLIFSWFLRPNYVVWHSPYYWGYYPPRYKHYRCLPTFRYHKHLHVHVDYHVNKYHYSNARRSPRTVELHRQIHRNDYGRQHPDRSFSSRNSGYSNKYELKRSRPVNERRQQGRSSDFSGSQSNIRPSYSQRRTDQAGTPNTKGATTKSSRSEKVTSSGTPAKRSYQSNGSGSSSYNRNQSSVPATDSRRSLYQRSESKTGKAYSTPSGATRQSNLKSAQPSSSGRSESRMTQSLKIESSSTRINNNANVSRSSRSSNQSVSKQTSPQRKSANTSSGRSSSRSEKKTERSSRR